jgi:hypothetical protein
MMANLTEYLTTKFTKMVIEVANDLGNQVDKVTELQNIFRALKNTDILVDGMPLTLDRLQIMEDGTHRILPPPPADTCQLEVSKDFAKPKNGVKEPVNAS